MFVVDDILIAKFVLPFAQGLGEHTLDGIYDWLDDQGVRLGRGLFYRLTKRRRGAGNVDELVTELGDYVAKHPDAASRLTAAALTDAGQVAKTDEEFLGVLRSFLMAVFELVKTLNRPAVLPGFVTGTEHLAVIDVRTRNAGEEFATPAIHPARNDDARIVLANRGVPHGQPTPLPRIWLVSATGEEGPEIDRVAAASARYLDWPDDFVDSMKGQWLATDITRREVWVQQPQITPVGMFVTKPGKVDAFNWSESPAGVIAMHKALVDAVGEKVEQDRAWIDAWSQALRETQ